MEAFVARLSAALASGVRIAQLVPWQRSMVCTACVIVVACSSQYPCFPVYSKATHASRTRLFDATHALWQAIALGAVVGTYVPAPFVFVRQQPGEVVHSAVVAVVAMDADAATAMKKEGPAGHGCAMVCDAVALQCAVCVMIDVCA